MASNSIDFLLNLRANPRGLDEISSSTSQMVQGFHDATRALSQVSDASQLNTENLQQMAAAGQQAVIQLNAELRVAQLELNRLAATNASPADLDAARDRVQALERSVQQTTTAVEAYQDAARAASQTPPVPSQFQNEVSSLVTELDDARRSIDATGNSSTHTRQQLEQMAANATDEIQRYERELNDARQEVNRLAATNATPEDIERARQRVRELETGIEQTRTALNGFRNAANMSTDGLEHGLERTEKKTNIARFAMTALATALASLGVGAVAQNLAKTSDSFVNLATRINIATKEGGNFEQAMAGVQQIALATNSNLTTTADLFTRLNTVGKDMGMTQKQALDLTKTVTQAIQIGGGSAEAADAAVTQFIQAMQGGVLRGEEFNSIMEGGYGLAEALAKGLGVTTGELRKMAEAGELSAERVIKAVSSQAESVQKTYDQFPTTIGNALQRVATSWEILIGQMDQANGASATVAGWLVKLADNLQELRVFLDDIGEGFVWIRDKLQSIDSSTINALKSLLSDVYETVKSLISNMATLGETIWSAFTSALDAVSPLFSALLSGGDDVSGLTTLLNFLRMAFAAVSDVATGFNIGLKLLLSGIQFLSGGLYALNSQVLDFLGFDTLAQQALNASDRMFAQAEKNGIEAVKLAENHKWAVVKTYDDIGKTQEQKDKEAVASSKAKLDQLLADQNTEATAKKTTEAEKIKAVQDYAEKAIAANKGVMDGIAQADLLTKGYMITLDQSGKLAVASLAESKKASEETTKANELAIERAKQAETDYQNFLKSSVTERILLTKQVEDAKKLGDLNALLSAQTSLAAIDAKERELSAARVVRNAEVVADVKNTVDQVRVAGKALGLDLDVALNKISEGFSANQKNLTILGNGLTALGVTGEQATEALYQGWEKWASAAKNQAEIDAAKAKLIEFEKQGVFSAKQVQMGMEYLDEVNGKIPENISEIEKAYKLLGVTSSIEAGKMATAQINAFNVMKQSGTASAEQIKQALINMADKIYASGDAAKIAWYESQLAASGLASTVDETGKKSVQVTDSLTSSVERLARTAGGSAVQGFRAMGDAAREAAREAKNSIDEWNDALTAKSDAQKAERDKSSSSKAVGSSFKSYSRAEVLAELKSMGYDDAQAKKLAGSIMSSAFDADKATMSKNIDPFINDQFNKLLGQGLTASAGSAEVQKRLASLANGTGLVTMANPKSTRRLEVSNGQQTATLEGSDQDVDTLESIMSEFEMLKKST